MCSLTTFANGIPLSLIRSLRWRTIPSTVLLSTSYLLWATQVWLSSCTVIGSSSNMHDGIWLGAALHHLKAKTSLSFFAARFKIWSPLSGIIPLIKPLDLSILLWIVVISSSDRLTRVLGETSPWSSASFYVTVWWNISHMNILCISSLMVKVCAWHVACSASS